MSEWSQVCGLALTLVGSQENFRRECAILKRLVRQFGASDVERMIRGAQALGWKSLRSLGSKEGLGRNWALQRYWQDEKRPAKVPESVKAIFRSMGQ